jgi:hypothetical protein
MKLIILFAFCLATLSAEDTPNTTQTKELAHMETMIANPWYSLSLTINCWMGDYWNYGPTILLQKSLDEKFVVSWIDGPEEDRLPVIVKILTKNEGEELHADLCRIFRMGINETAEVEGMSEEEIEAYIAKTRHSPAYEQMVLRIADSESKTNELSTKLGSWDIEQPKGAAIEFQQLVKKLRPIKKADESPQPSSEKPPR